MTLEVNTADGGTVPGLRQFGGIPLNGPMFDSKTAWESVARHLHGIRCARP